jgi:3-oxoacyl-[acyl-carrier-protein] synthase II
MARGAAIVGIGAVTPLGDDWPTTWRALLAGDRARGCRLPGPLPHPIDVEVVPSILRMHSSRSPSIAELGARAAREAIRFGKHPLRWFGGTNHGETEALLRLVRKSLGDDVDSSSADYQSLLNDCIPTKINPDGIDLWVYSACATGLHALALAVDDPELCQEENRLEGLVVAVDTLSVLGAVGFDRLGALSRKGCRPFDTGRDGLSIGEGAVAVLLRPPHLVDNNAAIGVQGIGMSCDAAHPTQPDPSGRYLEVGIRTALQRASCNPDFVGGVVLHGTGTPANDAIEAQVCQRIWGDSGVPVTSIKGAIGHMMGAAGLINAVVAVEASRTGLLPPTISDGGQVVPGIDLVRASPREIEKGRPVAVVAAGFGGNNIAAVVGPVRP